MEKAISTIYLDEIMAYQYLREIKKLVPETDTGVIKFISDVEVKKSESEVEAEKLKNIIYSEKMAINKIISIFYLQKNFTMFPETTKELQRVAKVMFDDCLRKGYQKCSLLILKCIVDKAVEIFPYEFPNKQAYVKKGLLDILSSYGERQILIPYRDLSERVISVINEAKQNRYKVDFTDEELLNAFNNAQIGSRRNKNKISNSQLLSEGEN